MLSKIHKFFHLFNWIKTMLIYFKLIWNKYKEDYNKNITKKLIHNTFKLLIINNRQIKLSLKQKTIKYNLIKNKISSMKLNKKYKMK